jgi:diacylglycerol kinase (ATP)
MGENKNRFWLGRIKSVKYAANGAFKLMSTEHSIIVQLLIASFLIFAGFYFNITKTEWMFQLFAIGLVLSVEGMNTAIEKIADFIHPDYHQKIGFIKDIAAGAVFFAAVIAIIIGLLIYYPYVYNLI